MHIAIDARNINSSTGRYIERLLHYLEQIDTTNTYTVLVPTKDIAYWQPSNKNFTVHPADFDNYSIAEQIGFKKLLNNLSADLVHFCMPQQPVLYKGAHVTTIHDLTLLNTYNSDKNWLIFHFKQLVGRFVFKHVARSSKAVITPTNWVKKSVVSFANIPNSKVTVTLEAADIVSDSPVAYKPMINKDYIMYVGNQSDYKNVKRLITAHQTLLTSHPNLQLVLVGKTTGKNGAGAGRNKIWSENQHYKNVVFTGFVPDEQLAWLYANTRAYVFPSLMEGFGLPGLEAMASGAPVVSSDASCLPEVHGKAALYFNPTDINDMTDKIDQVLSSNKIRDDLIKKGKSQVATFSWRRMAEQTHKVYIEALNNN